MRDPVVKLRLTDARSIIDSMPGWNGLTHGRALQAAISAAEKLAARRRSRPVPLPHPKPNANDRKAKALREDAAQARKDRKVYEAVGHRAGERCEACGNRFGSGLQDQDIRDHFWGRSKETTAIPTVWIICGACNRAKTDNDPGRAYWIGKFLIHCNRYGYAEQAARCVRELEAERAIDAATAMTRIQTRKGSC